jgi:fructose-1,6-bisphosphatase/inositol monophosphatase family enzyme
MGAFHRGGGQRAPGGGCDLPAARDLMFARGRAGGQAQRRAHQPHDAPHARPGASVLAARPGFSPEHWQDGIVPALTRAHRPSLAYRLAIVAQGRFDAMFTLRPTWEWDIAAGDLILREAGAITSDRAGAPLRFNNPHPQVNGVVAANPALHAALRTALVY